MTPTDRAALEAHRQRLLEEAHCYQQASNPQAEAACRAEAAAFAARLSLLDAPDALHREPTWFPDAPMGSWVG